ncbi:Spat [Trypoxylus dichotomus]
MSVVEPPDCLKKPLDVVNKHLMGAGPSNCSPRVLQALSLQVLGHLDAKTLEVAFMRSMMLNHHKLLLLYTHPHLNFL